MKETISNTGFYFHYRMPEFDKLLERIPKDNVVDKNFTWGNLCKVNRTALNINDYQDILVNPLRMVSEELGVTFSAKILHPWINMYERGSFQEVHWHDDCDIAAVIFLNDEPDFSKFYFFDANHTQFTKPWVKIITRIKESNIYYPKIQAGDVILFPSHMMHGVTPHQSDIIRKTMSFNVVITDVQ